METLKETMRRGWREKISRDKKFPRKPKVDIRRDLSHGWLLPFLLENDTLLWGRWDYWAELIQTPRLPPRPIPQIEWLSTGTQQRNPAHKMLEACLNAIPLHGTWQTWGSWSYFDYLMDWLLFGFGHSGQPEPPPEPSGCEGASDRLYQVFSLDALQVWPYDYFGDILAENKHGRGLGFYPTPMNVVQLMVGMLTAGSDKNKADLRTETVADPCLGTGRFLLAASNFSLRLYGMDINPTVIKASLVNGYIYAPWLVRPIPWLDGALNDPQQSATLSDGLVGAAAGRPDVTGYLAGTEHDTARQPYFEPIKKRRRQPELLPA